MLLSTISVLPVFAFIISAAELHLTTPSNLPSLPPSTRALLTRPSTAPIAAPVTTSNGFDIRNLTSGIYDLTIACRDYDFERDIVVEVDNAGNIEVFRVGDYGMGAKTSLGKGEDSLALEVRAIRRKEFYEERVGCECPLSVVRKGMKDWEGKQNGRMLTQGEQSRH